MEMNRFRQIIESYGAVPDRWPEAERDEALQLLATNPEAQSLIDREEALDRALMRGRVGVDLAALESRILTAIDHETNGWVERLVAWLLPDRGRPASFLRPTAIAALPLVFGVMLGGSLTLESGADSYTDDEMLLLMGLASTEEIVAMESAP